MTSPLLTSARSNGSIVELTFRSGEQYLVPIETFSRVPGFSAVNEPNVALYPAVVCGLLTWSNGLDISPDLLRELVEKNALPKDEAENVTFPQVDRTMSSLLGDTMPIISMFYGIVIMMVYGEGSKHKLPHVHVRSAEHTASIAITTAEVLAGSLPPKKLALVRAWIILHEEELVMNWDLCRQHQTPLALPPLQ
ncbi:MAG: DUF4160 domain-containing protein [Candidatus Kapabacteria bacterium]|nr:DUF4160 domain-containing protein [Candidatus Kapabacteria bacterium]